MAGIRDPFNACTKYVLTHRDEPLEWENSHRLARHRRAAEIKQGDGPDLVIQGSSTLYPQLLDAGLLDELTLMISPVVLGKGKRLFGDGTPPRTLKMTEHHVSDAAPSSPPTSRPATVKIGTYVSRAAERARESPAGGDGGGQLVMLALYGHPSRPTPGRR